MQNFRRRKYGNVKTRVLGREFDSKKEAEFALWLESEKQAGRIVGWEPQKRVDIVVANVNICRYIVDFEVRHKDGSIEWVEVKGFKTAVWRLKWKLAEALYPQIKKRIW